MIGSNPVFTGTDNGSNLTITLPVAPSVSIAASATTICSGTNVTFTATPTNGGTTPGYQWKLNGTNVGSNQNTYASTTLVNSDVITCVLTSNATCASPTIATSIGITMSVSTKPTLVFNTIGSNNNQVCSITTATALSAIPSGGVFSGPGVSGNNFNAVSAGLGTHVLSYQVNSGACVATDTAKVMVIICTALQDNAFSDDGITIYPTPASEILYLSNTGQLNLNWTLVNVYGATVKEGKTNTDQQIGIDELASGQYILLIRTKTQTFKKKVVVQNASARE